MGGGGWSCEKSQKAFDQPLRQFITSLVFMDGTGSGPAWSIIFNEKAVKLLGGTGTNP